MDLSNYSGPRVIINPAVMHDDRDALCVAFNESFRIIQEVNGFDPVAEPTEKQRAFFRDTAYNDDERMLRRTILSRICTFDTSVSDPTDEQLQEAVEFLDTVMEIGAPQNEWEQRSVQRIRDAIARTVGQPRAPEETPEPPAEGPGNAAAGGGETEEEALARLTAGAQGTSVQDDTSTQEEREQFLAERGMDTSLAETGSMDQLVKMQDDKVNAEAPESSDDNAKVAEGKPDKAGGEPQQVNAQPKQPDQAQAAQQAQAPVRTDAAGRQLDDNGRVMAGQKPSARPLTAGEQAWQDKRNASTQAWKERNGVAQAERDFARQEQMQNLFAGLFNQNAGQFAQALANVLGSTQQDNQAQPAKSALTVSGSRNNIFTLNGRRVSSREADAYKRKNGLV